MKVTDPEHQPDDLPTNSIRNWGSVGNGKLYASCCIPENTF